MCETVLLAVLECLEVKSSQGRRFNMNNRTCYGLSFCRSGKITYTMNGKKYVSDPLHAVILPKGGSYSLYGNESGSFPVINFDCLDASLGTEISVIPIHNSGEYLALFDRFQSGNAGEPTFSAKMSILYRIFDNLERENKTFNPLFAVEEYIQKHFAQPDISNKKLAEICHLSEVGFRKKFSKIYGISPKRYIIDRRMERAEVLLKTTDLNVREIAEQCGFSNICYFFKLFENRQSCTPKEYRCSKKIL